LEWGVTQRMPQTTRTTIDHKVIFKISNGISKATGTSNFFGRHIFLTRIFSHFTHKESSMETTQKKGVNLGRKKEPPLLHTFLF